MGWRKTNIRTAIGLDIGTRAVKAAQLVGRPGAWRLASAGVIVREKPGEPIAAPEVGRIAQVLSRQGFIGNRVVLTVPPDKLLSSILELPPPDSGAPTEQIAQAELASMHRVDPATLQMGYWELPSSGRQRESFRVMAAACTSTEADAYLDIIESQGLDVIALDVPQAALGRLVASNEHTTGIDAVLDLGWRSGLLVLLCRGVVIYERRLTDVGLEKLTKSLTTTLEVDESVIDCLLNEVGLGAGAEQAADPLVVDEMHDAIREHYQAMIHELSVSFSYAGHQYPDAELKRLSIVGGGAAIPGLDVHLSEQLGLDVSVIRPSGVVQTPGGLNVIAENTAVCVAVALAMHEEAR